MQLPHLIKRDLVIPFMRLTREGKPSHHTKRSLIRSLADTYKLTVLVETGTYLGEMVQAMKGHFDQIYSIELDYTLYEAAKKRFRAHENIEIIQGDSAVELAKLVTRSKKIEKVLFWLDGHFSEGITAKADKHTPVMEELQSIFQSGIRDYVIVVDDVSSFDGTHDYPTVSEFTSQLKGMQKNCKVEIQGNSFVIISPTLVLK